MKDLCISSISWARTEEEENVLSKALGQLAALNVPVYITDGGSPERFVDYLRGFRNFTVLKAKGLWPQVKNSINAARNDGARSVLYTEPDKEEFFAKHLPKMLQHPKDENTRIVVAGRSLKGFSTFPFFQQLTETTINQCCKEVIGTDIDYCYGPFLFDTELIPSLDALEENCGWGWRPFLFAMAHRLGFSIECFEGDFNCPQDQREDSDGERIYRMRQLAQNINGLVQAAMCEPYKKR